jgi:hypothetical protein
VASSPVAPIIPSWVSLKVGARYGCAGKKGVMKMNADQRATKSTRREALGMLGAGLATAALPYVACAQPSFGEGTVIRTILRDYAPGELGGGATLFHEHMSFAPDFLARFRQFAAEAQAINRPPNVPAPAAPTGGPNPDLSWMKNLDLMSEELATAKYEGIACIVEPMHRRLRRLGAFPVVWRNRLRAPSSESSANFPPR